MPRLPGLRARRRTAEKGVAAGSPLPQPGGQPAGSEAEPATVPVAPEEAGAGAGHHEPQTVARSRRRVRRTVLAPARGLAWVWLHLVRGLPTSADPAALRRRHTLMTGTVVVLAVVMSFIAFGVATATMDLDRVGLGVTPFIGALAGLPLALATTRPILGWAVSCGGAFAVALLPGQQAMPWPWGVPQGLVLLALLFSVASREPLLSTVGAWLTTLALFVWGVPPGTEAGWSVGVTTVALIGLLAGRLARSNRALARQAEETASEKAQRVLLEERARIARDLHDIVAHHMSLVVVQAETAPYRVSDLSPAATAELESISESARAALAETRALLSVLRREEDDAATAPQPGVDDLDTLVRRARSAGTRVSFEHTAVPPLRPGTSLAAYRIVQEALANAARHAAGAPVHVWIGSDTTTDGFLQLRVVNEPPDGAEPVASDGPVPFTPGHGVTGMQERASAEGGHVDVGPTAEGGFAVVARLPVAAVWVTE
ncbi:MAG TPA: histidine kinase [Actinomycetales bacterium]|nr:histidine kinase [Actinomycetales bacterium]